MNGQVAQHQRFRGIVTLALIGLMTFAWGAPEVWAAGTQFVRFANGKGFAVTEGTVKFTNPDGKVVTVEQGQFYSPGPPAIGPAPIAGAPTNIQEQIKNGEKVADASPVVNLDSKTLFAMGLPPPGGPTTTTTPCTPVVGDVVVGVTVVSPAGEPILGKGVIGCR